MRKRYLDKLRSGHWWVVNLRCLIYRKSRYEIQSATPINYRYYCCYLVSVSVKVVYVYFSSVGHQRNLTSRPVCNQLRVALRINSDPR